MGTTWGQLGDMLIKEATPKRIPIMGQFELTSRCNLRCKMCYINNPASDKRIIAQERTAREWIGLAFQARDSGMLYLLLTGGEVFIRRDFKEIYEEISMIGFNTHIYTNGTLISPKIAEWLGKIPPSRIEVTLYGMSEETYGKVCGCAGGFNTAMNGIQLLIAEGINLKLRMTFIRGNISDFDRFTEFSQKHELDFGFVKYISPRRDGSSICPEAERLSPEELVGFERYIDSRFENTTVPEERKQAEYEINEYPGLGLEGNSLSQEVADPFYYTAGKCSFWVTWDGKLTPCSLMDEPAAFPFESSFPETWHDLINMCSSIPNCAECLKCSLKNHCWTCPARLKKETGYYDKPADYLCKLAQNLNSMVS